MEKSRLKEILRDLKVIVSELESEVYSDVSKYTEKPKENFGFIVYGDDDDGDPD
jgi:hypothetical protein